MNTVIGTESIRTQVNSYLSQFVFILVNSYSIFGQFVLILLNLVNSYSFWSIRTQFGPRYLPSHVKNGIAILLCIFKSFITLSHFKLDILQDSEPPHKKSTKYCGT